MGSTDIPHSPSLHIGDQVQEADTSSVPLSVMDTLIVTVVKDREDIVSRDNYRPIAITNVVSNVFESVILDKYKQIETTPKQFVLETTAKQFVFN